MSLPQSKYPPFGRNPSCVSQLFSVPNPLPFPPLDFLVFRVQGAAFFLLRDIFIFLLLLPPMIPLVSVGEFKPATTSRRRWERPDHESSFFSPGQSTPPLVHCRRLSSLCRDLSSGTPLFHSVSPPSSCHFNPLLCLGRNPKIGVRLPHGTNAVVSAPWAAHSASLCFPPSISLPPVPRALKSNL